MSDHLNVAVNIPVGCVVAEVYNENTVRLRHEASGLEFQAELHGRHKTTYIHAATDAMSTTVYYVDQLAAAFHHNAWQFAECCKLVEDGDEAGSYWYVVPNEDLMNELLAMPT